PYYIDTNQDVFVRATLYCPDPNLMLSTDTCAVSPNRYDFTTTTYDLIREGCIRDPTYTNYYSLDKKTVQFKFRPRSFPRRHSAIYLQCKMAVCNKYNYFSRCYQGCMTRGKKGTSD
ncbi:DMBT1 protein, partial [Dromaius novaehollandiae]|nr:DMBT1 protein [Dromaius novaehollandiae]